MRVERLRVEYLVEPLALDEANPRFSWILTSGRRADRQTAFRVLVSSSPLTFVDGEADGETDGKVDGEADVWDSGRVSSARSTHIVYDGAPLEPNRTYHWAVRAWDADGAPSPWAVSSWGTGLLTADAWQASWIAAPADIRRPVDPHVVGLDHAGRVYGRPALMRTTFVLDGEVARARAFVTARGAYELHLNGERVGDDVLAPGWTDYRRRIPYQAHDVTSLLRNGDNTIGALVGDGWFCGRVAWEQRIYGEHPSFLAQLHIDLRDGRHVIIASDGDWRATASSLLWSDLLAGEAQDLAAVDPGWSCPAADDTGWVPVDLVEPASAPLVARRGPPVRCLGELRPVAVHDLGAGRVVADLGQNMAGRARLVVDGRPGDVITVRHAEMLNADGTIYTANNREAECTDAYILGGDGVAVLEPHLTYHGFRYVQIDGLRDGPGSVEVVGVVLGSDTPAAGAFACSAPMVDQLYHNIEWGQRSNFFDVPTDCPQRDERLGWMGDAQVFVPTACWNADVAAFFTKWLDDVHDARAPSGAFADIAPLVRKELFAEAAPGWGDAGAIVPWVLYQRYGDERLLARCFPAMAEWVAYVHDANPDLLWRRRRNMDYGDWLAIGDETPRDVLASAYFAHSAEIVARAARVLGRDDAEAHRELADRIRAAFNAAYVTADSRLVGHTQTAYVLAIVFDLLGPDGGQALARHLIERIEEPRGFKSDFVPGHLTTGFLGVGHLLPALTAAGHLDLAYRLLEADTFPSWGYAIARGATTIWERWDGWTEERGFQDPEMNSFNHYALGSVGDWIWSTVVGIVPDAQAPGFERFTVRPRPGGSISWVRAVHDCIRGRIAVSWAVTAAGFALDVEAPANTTATVWIPAGSAEEVTEGGSSLTDADDVAVVGQSDGCVVVQIEGGSYRFRAGDADVPTAIPNSVDAEVSVDTAGYLSYNLRRG